MLQDQYWPRPLSRSLGFFTEPRLFYEVLLFAEKTGSLNKKILSEEFSDRVKGLSFIKSISPTAIYNLLRELTAFNWIDDKKKILAINRDFTTWAESNTFALTQEGGKVLDLYRRDKRLFLHELISKMHTQYVIPGWFINRLWSLNPKDQGQIIIPSPIKDWNPSSRDSFYNSWNTELENQTLRSFEMIEKSAPGTIKVKKDDWIIEVHNKWLRLGLLKKRGYNFKKPKLATENSGTYTPRLRLALAMKEASVKWLFDNNLPYSSTKDFPGDKRPLLPRTFLAWCVRLEELELIFYTDSHPKIPGRLIFPVSVFRNFTKGSDFEIIKGVENLNDEYLCLYRPNWSNVKNQFIKMLFMEHQTVYKRTRSLYLSLQDVRDEVCRQMRLSSSCFNEFLKNAIQDSLLKKTPYIISVETDIREDQRNAYQIQRKPVYIGNKPYSLIAITK